MKKRTIIILVNASLVFIVAGSIAFVINSLNTCKAGKEKLSLNTKIASSSDQNLYLIAKSNEVVDKGFYSFAKETDYDKCEARTTVKLGFYYKSDEVREEQIYQGDYDVRVATGRKNDLEYDFTKVLKKYVDNLKVQKFNNDSTVYISGFSSSDLIDGTFIVNKDYMALESVIGSSKIQKWNNFNTLIGTNRDKLDNILNLVSDESSPTSYDSRREYNPDITNLDCENTNCKMTAKFEIANYTSDIFYKKAIIEINLTESEAIIVGGKEIL